MLSPTAVRISHVLADAAETNGLVRLTYADDNSKQVVKVVGHAGTLTYKVRFADCCDMVIDQVVRLDELADALPYPNF